ncbi:MAG: LysR family transcriptional regulator, partial [Janthinobacterium sp.]
MDRLEAMQVFCAVVEAGGFSKAAQRLGISTSSVTNQVAALEKHFGVRLLQRTTRSMSLTAEGRQCHAQARQMLADMAALESSLEQAAGTPSGSLRVDMPSSISRNLVAPALPRYGRLSRHFPAPDGQRPPGRHGGRGHRRDAAHRR